MRLTGELLKERDLQICAALADGTSRQELMAKYSVAKGVISKATRRMTPQQRRDYREHSQQRMRESNKGIGRDAYELRKQGYTWRAVGKLMYDPESFPPSGVEYRACNAARTYAYSRDMPWPVPTP